VLYNYSSLLLIFLYFFQKRQLDKEREGELDNQYMVDALNRAAADEELRERAR